MMAAVEILRDAATTAIRGSVHHMTAAGRHLSMAREYDAEVPGLAEIHRRLAEDSAARAVVWRREAVTFEAAAENLRKRLENRERELELAQRFHDILDASAAASAEDHASWEYDRLDVAA